VTVQEKGSCVLCFLKQSQLSKSSVVIELNMKKDPPLNNAIRHWVKHFQELAMFCMEKEREDGALRRKLLIESRELGHLACHERRHVVVVYHSAVLILQRNKMFSVTF
jgi:hypothetical protein